jgi:hypothetical protein
VNQRARAEFDGVTHSNFQFPLARNSLSINLLQIHPGAAATLEESFSTVPSSLKIRKAFGKHDESGSGVVFFPAA